MRVVLVAAILAIAAAVWGVGRIQSSADDSATHAITAGQEMLIAMLDQETGLRGYINTRDQRFLEPYRSGRARVETSISDQHRYATDANDQPLIAAEVTSARRWQQLAEPEISKIEAGARPTAADALRRKAIMDRFRTANARFSSHKRGDRDRDQHPAETISIVAVILLGAAFAFLSWILFERPAHRDARRRRR